MADAGRAGHSLPPLPWKSVLGVLLLALALRLVCLERTQLIGSDSARFLVAAERFERGDNAAALADPYHPLTAFAISRANLLQNAVAGEPPSIREAQARRERAAHWVLISMGLALVYLIMDLTRRVFPGVPPVVAGVFAASQQHLVRSSVDIMSDTLYLALFFFALREAVIVIQERRWHAAPTAGLAAGLAYLTRPEALVLLPAILAYWVLHEAWTRASSWGRTSARVALFLAAVALPAVPYIISISDAAGEVRLTLKKDFSQLVNGEDGGAVAASEAPAAPAAAAAPEAPLWLRSLYEIFKVWFNTSPEILGVCFFFGLYPALRRREWEFGHTLFAMIALLVVGALVALLEVANDPGYLSRRHSYTLVLLGIPIAARGVTAMGRYLAALWERVNPAHTVSGFAAVLTIAMGVQAIGAERTDQLAQLDAAAWLAANGARTEPVYTDREKVPYYAGSPRQELPPSAAAALAQIQQHERAWLVFYKERVRCNGLAEALSAPPPGFRLMQELTEPNSEHPRTLLVYRWERPAAPK
ncbi:MAG: glycosyltransferase family 39 protein [Planctomycetes bacterium]|nr:glycosyltransferase family 39 protein [Planctomycetota bacterium]